MKKDTAWKRFLKTGSVMDYLAYKQSVREHEEEDDAMDYRRSDYPRE